jgi:hypothetical protein
MLEDVANCGKFYRKISVRGVPVEHNLIERK